MQNVFELVAFLADICYIISFLWQLYTALRKANEKAKPSAATDGFDTGSEAQAEGPAL